jgi:ferrous-iron efflux pump FieF
VSGIEAGPSAVPEDAATLERGAQLMRNATYASVTVAIVLILVKAVAFILTDSVALLSSLIDSMLDAAAAIVNLLAIRQALTPADREHRFGHGKAEALAGLGQSAFIAGSAIFLVIEASHRLFAPRPLHDGAIGTGVMAFSVLVTLVLVFYQRRVTRATGSIAIGADLLHYLGDLLVNGGVILAILLGTELGWVLADPLIAILIAVYIVTSSWYIGRRALDQLMDRELPDEARARIKEIALSNPGVLALHDLRTRAAGPNRFIQLHLEMRPEITLVRAHGIADEVETELHKAFPGSEVIIHQDPAGIDEPQPEFAR